MLERLSAKQNERLPPPRNLEDSFLNLILFCFFHFPPHTSTTETQDFLKAGSRQPGVLHCLPFSPHNPPTTQKQQQWSW